MSRPENSNYIILNSKNKFEDNLEIELDIQLDLCDEGYLLNVKTN